MKKPTHPGVSAEICSRVVLYPPRGKQLEIPIERTITTADLDWPRGADSEEDDLGCNRSYCRLPKIGWRRVEKSIREERQVIDRLSATPDYLAAYDEWCDARESGGGEALIGLELGVNALVAALRAGRCLPFYSCNGGAFGGEHQESCPAVAFYCRAELLPFIIEAAEESDVGLVPSHWVAMAAYAQNADALIDMAVRLHRRRHAIADVRLFPITREMSGARAFLEKVQADRQLNLL
jgi:hypothetical protein